MPSLPDIPGKSLIEGTTRRTRMVAAAAGAGALAVGGFVVKRALGHGGGDGAEASGASADPIAETPTAPPGAEKKPTPKAEMSTPKEAKPKPAKPAKAPKPKVAKPKPAKSKAAKPAKTKPPKSAAKPSKSGGGKDPHHALNNPIDDPDPTEYPDPYEKREDPLDPADPDGAPFGAEPHPATGAESTSEPPLELDPEVPDGGKPPRRDNLDD